MSTDLIPEDELHDEPDCFGCGWQEFPDQLKATWVESEIQQVMLCLECITNLVVCDRCDTTLALDADDFDQVHLPATQEQPPEVDLICSKCSGEW